MKLIKIRLTYLTKSAMGSLVASSCNIQNQVEKWISVNTNMPHAMSYCKSHCSKVIYSIQPVEIYKNYKRKILLDAVVKYVINDTLNNK